MAVDALQKDFNGVVEQTVRLVPIWKKRKDTTMKLTTIVLATAFALSGTAALAQAGTSGYGSVVAPSVGSYVWPSVGSTNAVPTWRNTGAAAPLPSAPTVGNDFGNTFAPTTRGSGALR